MTRESWHQKWHYWIYFVLLVVGRYFHCTALYTVIILYRYFLNKFLWLDLICVLCTIMIFIIIIFSTFHSSCAACTTSWKKCGHSTLHWAELFFTVLSNNLCQTDSYWSVEFVLSRFFQRCNFLHWCYRMQETSIDINVWICNFHPSVVCINTKAVQRTVN